MHEGQKVTHPGLHRALLRGVRILDEERVFVVQIGHFRGQIEVEEVGFFVRDIEPETGRISLSDRSTETLDPASLRPSETAQRCCAR